MDLIKKFALLLFALLIFPVFSGATNLTVKFSLSGSGSLLQSPPGFEGVIDSGDLSGGYFTIYIDDTDWPSDDPGTPENERWDYIISTFFTYTSDSGNEHWTGYFPLNGTYAPPVVWHFFNNGDNLGGVIRYLVITIKDDDADGVIDQDELMNQAVAGNLQCHIEQSTGVYQGMCGLGSMNGNLEDYDPSTPDILTIPVGNLYLRDYSCGVPTKDSTWGAVKSLYAQ